MKCFTCQTECLPSSKFCQNCGRDFRPKKRDEQGTPKCDLESMRRESLTSLEALKSIKLKRAAIAIGISVLLSAFLFYIEKNSREFSWLCFAPLVIGWVTAYYLWRFGSSDYYAVKHSKDPSGNHRCIWCSNKGIWQKGEYRTDNKHSHCSKCKAFLFTE